jgi:hypothetical protein
MQIFGFIGGLKSVGVNYENTLKADRGIPYNFGAYI